MLRFKEVKKLGQNQQSSTVERGWVQTMVHLISKLYYCLEEVPHIGASLRLNRIMDILEVSPQGLYLVEETVSEFEDGCQREADLTSVTSLLRECVSLT